MAKVSGRIGQTGVTGEPANSWKVNACSWDHMLSCHRRNIAGSRTSVPFCDNACMRLCSMHANWALTSLLLLLQDALPVGLV
jgi:hypothetical protein